MVHIFIHALYALSLRVIVKVHLVNADSAQGDNQH